MSLFDTVYYKDRDFQTKDLHCAMSTYDIKDGRLFLRKYRREELPESEWKGFVSRKTGEKIILCKHRMIRNGEEDTNFHGWLNFYTYSGQICEEYNAKFTDGQLIEVIPK